MYSAYAHQKCGQYPNYASFGFSIFVTFMSVTPEVFLTETTRYRHVHLCTMDVHIKL